MPADVAGHVRHHLHEDVRDDDDDPVGDGHGTGLHHLAERDVNIVFVYGDPQYYSRFGFTPESSVETPYPLPTEWVDAWQSLWLEYGSAPVGGKLSLPEIWLDPALWTA